VTQSRAAREILLVARLDADGSIDRRRPAGSVSDHERRSLGAGRSVRGAALARRRRLHAQADPAAS
jgi:hypothetical protein